MSREDDHEAVGYKRPPQHSQFKKGKSGNPSGRRKGKPLPDMLELMGKVMSEPILLTKNGRPVRVSLLEAFLRKTVEVAAKGDAAARRDVLKLLLERQSISAQPEAPTSEQDQAMIAAALARLMGTTGGHDA